MLLNKTTPSHQNGFSLVELLVGLVIGLLATLVIMQVFSTFEGQKRTTTGSADAQTNGSIALFTMQRDIQMAGFGLPVFDTQNPPLKCDPATPITVDHDGVAATPVIDMFPIQITDGGAAGSDTVSIRYATDGALASGGIAVKIIGPAPAAPEVGVDTNFGCKINDVVLLSTGSDCGMTRVTALPDATHITLVNSAKATIGGSLACLGQWNQFTYAVGANQLQRNDALQAPATNPIVSDIVNMQAQYGISAAANSNQITAWVDATGAWANPGVTSAICDAANANRNCIKAVHIGVIARNGLLEKEVVPTAAPEIWTDIGASAAPVIDLSGDADWQRYRYRVYETIIPLRNMIWSRNTL
jgi:type IV pilus assembly protein PilW